MNKTIVKFVSSLIYVLLGLALLLKPLLVEDLLCYIIAGAAAAVGIVRIISYLFTKVEDRIMNDTNGLAVGLSLLILALFVLLKGTMFIMLFPFVLGFMITYKGVEGIQNVVNLKKFGYPAPMFTLVIAAVITVFGIVVMMNPFSTALALFRMLGVGLFVSGVVDILMDIVFTIKVRKGRPESEEPVAEAVEEAVEEVVE
ncbi:MAG: DUF308 domain-containing protein [Firmicutes bacterium]|nr:DUF308 domain-containing protein [Bacillota bacterium]